MTTNLVSYISTAGKFMVHKDDCKSLLRANYSVKPITLDAAKADSRSFFCKKCFQEAKA